MTTTTEAPASGQFEALDVEDVAIADAVAEAEVLVLPLAPVQPMEQRVDRDGERVLVPFAGAEHDWAAVELAAWIAGAEGSLLRLAGPAADGGGAGRDASRLLASASLAIQRALGVPAEPLLVAPGEVELLRAADEAALLVVGLSDRWRKDGLGPVRGALAARAAPATVLVRRGMRPGGLAPRESLTRFTWSLASSV